MDDSKTDHYFNKTNFYQVEMQTNEESNIILSTGILLAVRK